MMDEIQKAFEKFQDNPPVVNYNDIVEQLTECFEEREQAAHYAGYMSGLDAARRWIPVSERPKENGKSLLVLDRDSRIYEAAYFERIDKFLNAGGEEVKRVTHWQPAPELSEV